VLLGWVVRGWGVEGGGAEEEVPDVKHTHERTVAWGGVACGEGALMEEGGVD